MKKLVLLAISITLMVFSAKTQTLYVPGGTSGIGSASGSSVGINGQNSTYPFYVTKSSGDASIGIKRASNSNHVFLAYSGASSFSSSAPLWVSGMWANTNDYTIWSYPGSGMGIRRFVIDTDGNVGIGTSTPASELDVLGRITGGFGARTTGGVLDWNDVTNARSGNGYSLLFGDATNGPSAAGHCYYHPFNFEYNTKDGSGNITQLAIPYGAENSIDNGIYMRARYAGIWREWVKIISENRAGNVGIGTNSPTSKLHVSKGTSGASAHTYTSAIIEDNDHTMLSIMTPSNMRGFIGFADVENTFAGGIEYDHATDLLKFRNSNANNLVLDQNGNIGIGIDNPQYTLDVTGDINLTGNIFKDGEEIYVSDANYNLFIGYQAAMYSPTGEKNTLIGAMAGRDLTTGSYNTLIGETTGRNITTGEENTMIGYQAGFYNTTGISNVFIGYNAGVANNTGNANVFVGRASGKENVSGIRNTYLGYGTGLHSTGRDNIFIGYTAGYNETGSNKLYIENTTSDAPLIYGEFDNDLLVFNGDVGIGTSSTNGYKLAVNGTIMAEEVQVQTNFWPDYVFTNNYKLNSLEEVENYISENKHLPDVPSEEEVKENGIGLGEMNAVLLQKIEELTLYLIEQNKTLEKQQELLENQNVKIEELHSKIKEMKQ